MAVFKAVAAAEMMLLNMGWAAQYNEISRWQYGVVFWWAVVRGWGLS